MRASRALALAAVAAIVGGGARAAAPLKSDWAALAIAHEPQNCVRCRPLTPASATVADVVRRMRRETGPTAAAPAADIDLTAELRHLAAAPADDQPRQALRITDELAQRDLQAGASFVAALPPGRIQSAGMTVVAGMWVRRDRKAALEWAQALPEAAGRDGALNEVTRRLVTQDAPAAAVLVAALPTGAGRDAALEHVVRHWAKADRAAALAWLRTLPEHLNKPRILSSLELAAVTTAANPE